MLPQPERSNQMACLSVAEGHVCRLCLTTLTVGAFFSPKGTLGFDYYYFYFTEVPPALLPAGPG